MGRSGRQKHNFFRKLLSGTLTVIIIPSSLRAPLRFGIRGVYFGAAGLLGVVFFAGATASLIYSYRFALDLGELDRIKQENQSIRSEAVALTAKLKDLQTTLKKVEEFSQDIRQATQIDSQPALHKNSPIGPLTPEEQRIKEVLNRQSVQSMGGLKLEDLEFKEAFENVAKAQVKGNMQAENLKGLLSSVQARQKRLESTPNVSPVVGGWISSTFGWRSSPFDNATRKHFGLDIAADPGALIRAPARGTVVRVDYADDYGRYLEVDHGYGLVTRYAHTSKVLVKVGDKVDRGTPIANVGETGRSTGPHLHYEVVFMGKRVDPTRYIKSWR